MASTSELTNMSKELQGLEAVTHRRRPSAEVAFRCKLETLKSAPLTVG